METIEFLDLVWGDFKESVWVDLPSKAGGHWIPYPLEWPDDRVLARRRIQNCLEDGEDIYFSVARFRGRGRRIADVLPTHWLWADLDRVDPVFLDEDGVLPTISWESSPGRYQCLWRLNVQLDPQNQTRLNRALTQAIGADRGGYDLTQVLRPPGTRNFKYGDIVSAPNVSLQWDFTDTVVYTPGDIVKAVRAMGHELEAKARGKEAAQQAARVQVDLKSLPARARRLLNTPTEQVVEGERSSRLWELECLLLEHGLSEEQVYALVEPTAWNKWKELNTGEQRLRDDIAKASRKVTREVTAKPTAEPSERQPEGLDESESVDGRDKRSPFVSYANFISSAIETPKWLVQDIWSGSSHGFFGGEPKTAKSTVAMALGLSIASGRPFLGREEFTVGDEGPVLMIQEENAPWVVQDRLRKIAYMYGLIRSGDVEFGESTAGSLATQTVRLDFPDEVPFKMLNNYGFSLFEDEDRELLEEAVQAEGAKAVILDPLYLVAPGLGLNNAADVTPILKYLMDLRFKLDCAVIVVHHMHKASDTTGMRRAGQRLMGSGLFHGWIESALYFEDLGSGEGVGKRVRMEREFRNVGPRTALELTIDLGEPGDLGGLDVKVNEWNMGGLIEGILEKHGGKLELQELVEEIGLISKSTGRNSEKRRKALIEGKKLAVNAGFFVTRNGRGSKWIVSSQLMSS